MRIAVVLAGCVAVVAEAAGAATEAHIGSWVLGCPVGDACLLRAEKRFVDKAGVIGELEVLADGPLLVPVIALRGLSTEVLMAAALAGKTSAFLQFAGGVREGLDCGPSAGGFICAPAEGAAAVLAAGLPGARSVRVVVTVEVAGLKPLRVEEASIGLSGTAEALARLRAAGPLAVPRVLTALASPSAGALLGVADRALKAAGYPNGVADLRALVAKYRGK